MMPRYGNEWGAILLAAGFSRRFGCPKLLQPLADGMPLGVPSALALQHVFSQVVAVVNPQQTLLAGYYQELGVHVIVNQQAEQGMGLSIAKGVEHYQACQGWVIALADMPLLKVSSIQVIADALAKKARIVAPTYCGHRGHPVGFAAEFASELMALQGDKGAGELLQRHARQLQLIPVDDAGVVKDIDTKEDFLTLL